ncbi:MAG: sulfatase-like hydrolase/transferase [Candidatus Firestonebacteria bacterium]
MSVLQNKEVTSVKRPNVLFIMDDQHNAKYLGCAGHPTVKTPNIDSLANEGVRFTNAFCQTGICTPSRVSFLTGLYTHTHKVYGNGPGIPETLLSIGSYLQEYGYQTFASGKLHLPGWKGNGFQKFIESGLEPNSSYGKYLEKLNLKDKMDYFGIPSPDNPTFPSYTVVCSKSRIPVEHSLSSFEASEMIRFIEKRDKSKPFFGWLTFTHPHEPFPLPEPYASMYRLKDILLPPFKKEWWDKIPPEQKEWAITRGYDNFSEEELKICIAFYCGLISLVDWNIGRVLKRLKELGLEEDTVVIFSSDHGDFAGEHGWINKGFNYDAINKIPMILKFPKKFVKGEVRQQLVESVDIFPTICEVAKIPVPVTYPTRQENFVVPVVQGKSLLPLLLKDGGAISGKEEIFTEWLFAKTVRTKRYKLVFPSSNFIQMSGKPFTGELYDLEKDPFEWSNLYYEKKYSKIHRELEYKILSFFMKTEIPANAMIQLITSKDHIDWWKEISDSKNIDRNDIPVPTVLKSSAVLYKKAKW